MVVQVAEAGHYQRTPTGQNPEIYFSRIGILSNNLFLQSVLAKLQIEMINDTLKIYTILQNSSNINTSNANDSMHH